MPTSEVGKTVSEDARTNKPLRPSIIVAQTRPQMPSCLHCRLELYSGAFSRRVLIAILGSVSVLKSPNQDLGGNENPVWQLRLHLSTEPTAVDRLSPCT